MFVFLVETPLNLWTIEPFFVEEQLSNLNTLFSGIVLNDIRTMKPKIAHLPNVREQPITGQRKYPLRTFVIDELPKIVTIGAYGFDKPPSSTRCNKPAKVDTFCDIRLRRGVRGAQYAFANSQRLQARLTNLNIRYLYRQDLAPTKEICNIQDEADKSKKPANRQRTALGEVFIAAYKKNCLAHFDPESLLAELPVDAAVVALFCVERVPEACHRSLVAELLARELKLEIEHLVP